MKKRLEDKEVGGLWIELNYRYFGEHNYVVEKTKQLIFKLIEERARWLKNHHEHYSGVMDVDWRGVCLLCENPIEYWINRACDEYNIDYEKYIKNNR